MPSPKKTVVTQPPAPPDELPEQLLGQFRMLLSVVKAHFQAVEQASGLGGAQVWALATIAQQPGLGVGDLARRLSVRQPTASNLLKSLVDAGLVRTTKDTLDRRLSHLHITPSGRQRLAKVPGPMSGVLPDALRQLDPASAAQLKHHLGALLNLLDVAPDTAQLPLARL